jgi:EmrB/QacA subfamily drug resistance transporter
MFEGPGPIAERNAAPTAATAPPLGRRERFEIVGAILLGLLLGALDQTIVGVALPRIVTDLRGNDLYTWTVTIYLLTSTITVPFWGKLSDLYGRKPLLLAGITIFLAGSALCGLSQEMWQLILFRGIQGIGAGSLFPIALAVVGDLFSPAERGRYQGLFAAVFGFAALIGPALGGFLTDAISWHAIFYVNIPVGLVSLAVIARVLPPIGRRGLRHDLDILGAAVFTAAVAPFLVGLTNAQSSDWATPEVGGLVLLGVALFVVFLGVEARAREPIISLSLLRERTVAATIAATFFASFGFFAAVIFLPLYFQVVLGKSATVSGYEMFPLLIGVMAGSIGSGQIVARTGRYKALILGSLVLVAGGSFLLTNLRADTDIWVLRAWMLVLGLGIGPTLAVFTIVLQNAVPVTVLGAATSALTFFRQIGGSVGLAVAGTYFGTQLKAHLPTELAAAGVPAQLIDRFGGTGFDRNEIGAGVDLAATIKAAIEAAPLPPAVRDQVLALVPNVVRGIYEAMARSIGDVFWLAVGTAILAFLASLAIREIPLRRTVGHVADRASEPEGRAAAEPGAGSVEARPAQPPAGGALALAEAVDPPSSGERGS